MGLDMYARSLDIEIEEDVDFEVPEGNIVGEDLAVWRKCNTLHGWMARLYEQKGGTEEFNCTPLKIVSEDLDALEEALKDPIKNLPPMDGFFFGLQLPMSANEILQTRKFIEDAREEIKEGRTVIYECWY